MTRIRDRFGNDRDFAYDAEGRMAREGSKTYRYGYLDKVLSVTDGDTTRTFTYHADGQLASATVGGDLRAPRDRVGPPGGRPLPETESFLWDGLALIQRGDEQFVNGAVRVAHTKLPQ